ncbi:hypothetical protein HYZ70_02620, partial [Candidatus Curtissbacteria bacterium]|nr:hypothetical protein [Candidatus Curtissbacteria bacterium]
MYAEIVVLTYQPPDIATYTYKIPEELTGEIKVGQLVSVPFGKRNPMGIVLALNKVVPRKEIQARSNLEMKSLSSIILKKPLLLPYQIKLLKWMVNYYHAPMVNCLEAMLPTIPGKLSAGMIPLRGSAGVIPDSHLVLVPSISHIPLTLAQYPQAMNYALYHNELTVFERFAAWQRILSGSHNYVFGSRSAIFTPCPNLKEIIIYDEHEEGYHDERSPYYNTLTIAEKLQELTGAKLKIIDSSPKVTTYFKHSPRLILARDQARINLSGPQVKIVNMLDEKKIGNRSPLSQILEEYIKKGYAKKKKILLFLNKKSQSGHV